MRRLQKPPVAEAKTSEKEPLAEGLQVRVPKDSSGRRLWSKMSDREIVEYAREVIGKKGINRRNDLKKNDRGLHLVLNERELFGEVGFGKKQKKARLWKGMKDEDIVELARKLMKEKNICTRRDLHHEDPGLYAILRKRDLFTKIEFKRGKRSWAVLSDREVIEIARKVIEEREINRRIDLENADSGLYSVLLRRGLVDLAFAGRDQQKNDHARDAVIEALEAFCAEPTS